MASVDFPPADSLDSHEHVVGAGNQVVIPPLQLRLRYEQEVPFEGALGPDDAGHVQVGLPVFVRVDVKPEGAQTECFLIATQNKRGFNRGGDALTAYGAVHRTNFTFRTDVFHGFPQSVVRHNSVRLRRSEWNEIAMALKGDQATYWINRVPIATCFLQEGDIPSTEALYVGLTSYESAYTFRRFDVSRDPSPLSVFNHRVLTLHREHDDEVLRIRCLNMSGEEALCLDVEGATQLLVGTQVAARRPLRGHPCWEQDGRMIYSHSADVHLPSGRILGTVRKNFDNGEVALSVDESAGLQSADPPAAARIRCPRRRGWSASVRNQLALIMPNEVSALVPQGGERLGEFRSRVASRLGVFSHNLKLALPDGTLLERARDAEALHSLLLPDLTSSAAEVRRAA